MPTLLMKLDSPLRLDLVEGHPEFICKFAGRPLRKVSTQTPREFFYDWTFDAHNMPVAFEIRLERTDSVYDIKPPMQSLEYISFSPFPVIWLTESRTGTPAGMESWAGLQFYRDDADKLIIAVEVGDDLVGGQLEQLQKIVKSHRFDDYA